MTYINKFFLFFSLSLSLILNFFSLHNRNSQEWRYFVRKNTLYYVRTLFMYWRLNAFYISSWEYCNKNGILNKSHRKMFLLKFFFILFYLLSLQFHNTLGSIHGGIAQYINWIWWNHFISNVRHVRRPENLWEYNDKMSVELFIINQRSLIHTKLVISQSSFWTNTNYIK